MLQISKESPDKQAVAVLKATGRLDANTVNIIERNLTESLLAGARVLVLDLAELTYISSSGLRALLTAKRNSSQKKGDLLICALKRNVRDVFDMVGFSAVFKIYDDVEAALAAAQQLTAAPAKAEKS
jgi:anti-anti-sigma factor